MPGFVTCGPNEALVVSGCCLVNPTIVPGGRVFVWPFIQRAQKLTLNTMTLTIESPKVYTQQGVPISVTGIAQLFFELSILLFVTPKKTSQIQHIARETLEGHQRAIMCTMSVEEIYKDRKVFQASF
ncbi:hypothetical protein CEXT_140741 [Caerostris extrusa]|uniref:Band 7 domain-containing protein n=1 Tax=Caerostris extrusa TaxID=172846 RepID=A0AAV4Q6K1_CAEEX|nr:hypothetical protein CEXT_140741 [Caerostris extrusa]